MATPFTDFFQLTSASSGATRNSGTNGDFNALANWALPQAGWTRPYHNAGTNESVFAPPGGGVVLYLRHDSAASGSACLTVARAAESASAYNVLTDPFPTVAQVANTSCNWLVSSTANTTDRPFIINVWETGFLYFSKFSSTSDVWEWGGLVYPWARLTGDTSYPWLMIQRNSTATSNSQVNAVATSSAFAVSGAKAHFMRDFAGVIKSSTGYFNGRGGNIGTVPGAPAIRAGVGNTVDREKLCVHDLNSSTNTVGSAGVLIRGCIPNIWTPLHSSLTGVTETDVLTDATYNVSSTFTLLKANTGNNGIILENTNTSDGFPGA